MQGKLTNAGLAQGMAPGEILFILLCGSAAAAAIALFGLRSAGSK